MEPPSFFLLSFPAHTTGGVSSADGSFKGVKPPPSLSGLHAVDN